MKRPVVLLVAFALLPAGWAQASHAVNDPYYSKQWGHKRTRAAASWHRTEGKGTVVAVLDTGVSPHEDLNANLLWPGFDAIDRGTDARDHGFHGTHVAGIISAARNNGRGIVGVAPRAKILPVRVLGPDGGSPTQVASGLIWAADHGAKVINMSLGAETWPTGGAGGLGSHALHEHALAYAVAKGAVVVAAAGNATNPMCGTPALSRFTLCVGALDKAGGLAGFSNYGAGLDVVAPGTGIWSSTPFGYAAFSGTSAAAPFVSGVAAQMMAMGATNAQATAIIIATAEDRGLPGYDHTYGWGVVDARAAVDLCAQICP